MAQKKRPTLDREPEYSRVIWREKRPPRGGRGRYPAISDDDLEFRRNSLVDFLESAWGEVGWALRNARAPADLLKAFGPTLEGSRPSYPFKHLWQETALKTTSIEIKRTRQAYDSRLTEAQQLLEAIPRQTELIEEAKYALSEARSKRRFVRKVRADLERREAEMIHLRAESARTQERLEDLKNSLSCQEAYFAQSQFLAFLKGRRFRFTPRNVANAIAGLPFIGCRESYLRCRRIPCGIAPHFHYLAFQTIEYVLRRGKGISIDKYPELFRDGIRKLLSRHKFHKIQRANIVEFLEKEIPSLRKSIEIHMKIPGNSRALPYKIIASYVTSRRQPLTPLDRVLASGGATGRTIPGSRNRRAAFPGEGD